MKARQQTKIENYVRNHNVKSHIDDINYLTEVAVIKWVVQK